ncbi:2-succinyl-5-enolpyruvyl-6-hydroxy-3-cyclohexene-1-carboxylic-acid synthase [Rhodocyclus purpureus]|uniref:2-succinyl-5-enolpyruvyl-6-hydroxy-3- cyclohexene-1-carboxylic-acid synthase n=1 Tax=Rhodocyclus purpureus TaxID=1067 RepID=UPI001914D3A7|nr:2-succinyl-5-enolpyruvyl-6-hydroxy-3-cyclohexene-1-carboxylic-acid synthase [Rhodocyclus purpureus]MBK5915666.1 2-succinyl-5-enolpyruvyl-6-hydroxy-3-cyclohexene-1-carboxylic-acid synthase [Rhodocyclus purpureus]
MNEAGADQGLTNLLWAQTFVDALAAAGLRDAVISPGSRSTPLALALLRQPAIRSTVVIDERCAAFFALGRAKDSGLPVALLCTSGSAPANWFPAVIEAAQSATPLLLMSADRPAELQGWGANQTVDQLGLFGTHVRAAHALEAPQAGFAPGWLRRFAARIVAESLAPLAGPVHVNLPFREPLLPAADPAQWPQATTVDSVVLAAAGLSLPDPAAIAATAAELSGRPGIIVCGGGRFPAGFAEAILALAAALDCPVFAEPLSGLRFGAHFAGEGRRRICVRHESFLRSRDFVDTQRPDWVLRFGDFPVTKQVQQWLAAVVPAMQIVVAPPGRWSDPQHAATRFLHGDALAITRRLASAVTATAPPGWCEAFARAEAAVERALEQAGSESDAFWEGVIVPALLARLPAGFRFFCGASMAIRDLDTFSGSSDKLLAFFTNRGASGIDGNLSTAAGISGAGATLALVGDLTCAHDSGGLALARGRPLLVVVVNNGGGGIFEYLAPAALPEFARGWLTPVDADFAHLAATWGITYRRAATLTDLQAALDTALATLARNEPCLIEAVVDRPLSLSRHRDWWRRAAAAVDALAGARTAQGDRAER